MAHPLSQRINDVLDLDPAARAIQYDGRWFTWGQVATLARRVSVVSAGTRVGIMLRNQPAHVAALLGVLATGGTVVVINPSRGDERTRADIAALGLPVLIGLAEDIATLAAPSPATTTLTIRDLDTAPEVSPAQSPSRDAGRPEVAVRMLTSGTTGPPKRVDLTYDMLARSVFGRDPENSPAPTELRRGVAIVNSPLVHVGGVFRVLLCIAEARSFVLLPKFELQRWVDAVREHQPRAVSLVPAALRMVLHSELTRDDLAGVRAVTSGTAPLSADDADAFTEKFGIPVLTSYAATEFGGGVAGWTLADHQKHWKDKRGSVGRANPGARLRVVDENGNPLPPNAKGLLEVKPAQFDADADWLRTTDLARIDGDGFVWILGRADQAIIRGGFKVIPDDVRTALESHPAVRGAAVIGRPDDRLGETPVAMVELHGDASAAELLAYLGGRLARYEIPTDIAIVETIPRTPSGKPDLGAVREHFSASA
ncbi:MULTISPECIES: class I adenylate-forming enzyme family protein [unclassified Mycolicibacterium]|uniref:class I adenylate-forming enzyme family protein n=1 Tax=unclassified Mycolicibacterium TaxID=2636767 RepID=UPI0012DD41C4|nr:MULTISPECIES: AMP-binding protein [unclassified Mycolicibacterium]MUL80777.1 AMP-binding protein [Mycolicibacterium sp. CBMA 329]MUL86544.1 AMP-binding protein [Mycolicibacterium sp. CBMA 331]MUM01405.1 AMP-binding protein [Mycolicibacterium sp. CBMA 334]MUM25914.1 AMP-binding protein [Mycolicibacterium sp. CBMA 295]MUM36840.1 AMP-binding protein [Mycolicibacterium sp. CBMA 247]